MQQGSVLPTSTSPAAIGTPPPAPSPILRWIGLYVARPLGQIMLFILISVALMVVLSFGVALLLNNFRDTYPDGNVIGNAIGFLKAKSSVDLVNIVRIQLPGMIVNGLTIGFVYAIIALGYTMVYGVLKFVNFAHSEIFMVGGVVGYEVMFRLSAASALQGMSPFILVPLMIVVSAVVCGLLAVTIERIAYKPLRNAPKLVPLISAIGVSFLLQDIVRAYSAIAHQEFNLAYPNDQVPALATKPLGTILPSVQLNLTSVLIILAAILMLVGLNYFVNGTRLGKAIRAVSQDQSTASLMGINVNLMISITFLVGGALGGAAGALYGLRTTRVNGYIGFLPGLKAFTAAVLGGIGNITGALLGGILLGMLESFFSGLLPYFESLGTGYSDILVFAILIIILIFRPAGLLGKKVDEKV